MRRLAATCVSLCLASCSLTSPSPLSSPSPAATACNPNASSARFTAPLFNRPFAGDFPTGNLFDHDKPAPPESGGEDLLSMCGVRIGGQVNGHPGYDWSMPEGTTLLAVADGVVLQAGLEAPTYCAPLKRTVQALFVLLQHVTPQGDEVLSIYGHLSRVDVSAGQTVRAGSPLGLSGNTGCSGTPHLHFGAYRGLTGGNYAIIDPYGWHAAARDPWEDDPQGAASLWLWRNGEGPALR
jgi:murein DD-endopeptidase MepM/ murein hydrolase activator NlpD